MSGWLPIYLHVIYILLTQFITSGGHDDNSPGYTATHSKGKERPWVHWKLHHTDISVTKVRISIKFLVTSCVEIKQQLIFVSKWDKKLTNY